VQHIHYSQPKPAVDLMQRLKSQMDPNGILNPYKLLPRH
jgi:FAD/FMN-containing dehydrogenase